MTQNKKQENVVTFWTLQLGEFDEYMSKIIDNFEKENPNIKVEWIDVPYSEGEKRVLASLLSNSMPDLVNITSDFATTLAGKNALYLLKEKDVADYSQQVMNTLKLDESYIAYPFYATSAITYYNKDLVRKAGLTTIPQTYEELNSISKSFFEKTQKDAQMPTLCENDTFLKMLNKYQINSIESFNSKKTQKIYEEYKNLYQNGYIPKESITQTHRETLEKYGAGQIAFLQAGSNFLNIIKENSPQVFSQTDVAPQLKTTESGYDFSLMVLAIPKKAHNIENAKKFAQYLLNGENQLEFAKLTSILPVNKMTLLDPYFTSEENNNLSDKARKISVKQMKNLQKPVYLKKGKKEILNAINNSTQAILQGKVSVTKQIETTSQDWKKIED